MADTWNIDKAKSFWRRLERFAKAISLWYPSQIVSTTYQQLIMNTALIWILVTVSSGGSATGHATVIGKFKDQPQCEHVQKNLPSGFEHRKGFTSRCIQAEFIIEK